MEKNILKKRQLGCIGCITTQTATTTRQNKGNQLGNLVAL